MSQPPLQPTPPPPDNIIPPPPPRREWSRLTFWATLIVVLMDIGLLVVLIIVAYGRISTGDLAPLVAAQTPPPLLTPTARPTPTIASFANTRVVSPVATRLATLTAGTPAVTRGRVGETLVQNGYILIVNQVQRADSFQQFTKAKDGNTYIALDLTIQSSKDSGVQVNPLNCTLKDSQGVSYSIGVFGKDPILASQNNLPNGNKIRGWVTFEVPKAATGLVFQYQTQQGDVSLSVTLDS